MKRNRRGMTLLEILVVLAILGIMAAAIAVGVINAFERAKIKNTSTSALTLRQIVVGQRLMDETSCPTIESLRKSAAIDAASKTVDEWNHPFSIVCEDTGEIRITSAGPDGHLGTADDIRAPEPPVARNDPRD